MLLFGVTEGHVRRVRCGAVSMPSEPMTAAADTIVAVAFDMWVKMGEERRGSEERGKEGEKERRRREGNGGDRDRRRC